MTESEDPLAPIIARLKEPASLGPEITARVMAEINALTALEPDPRSSPVKWWRRRWTIQLSPLGALAVAAGLAAVVLAGRLLAGRGSALSPVAAATDGARLTQFILVAPEAATVTVVGDFNDWSVSATPLVRVSGDGVWWVTMPLAPGRYRYAFVVNGTLWRPDPEAAANEDEFGRPSSVLTIGGA